MLWLSRLHRLGTFQRCDAYLRRSVIAFTRHRPLLVITEIDRGGLADANCSRYEDLGPATAAHVLPSQPVALPISRRDFILCLATSGAGRSILAEFPNGSTPMIYGGPTRLM